MLPPFVFLDESGDLGWKFDTPYRKGGSSRYLTIAALIVPQHKKHLPKRLIKDLYVQHKWSVQEEKKWAKMESFERMNFIKKSGLLFNTHKDIQCTVITVNKIKVQEHIRSDSNKLYNYMIGIALLEKIKYFDKIVLSPDPRSIKIQSGKSLPDYLQTQLWFEKHAKTKIIYEPMDSAKSKSIQFVDMLAGAVHRYHEDGNNTVEPLLKSHIQKHELFF